MFGKTDAEKYQALFGILALISLVLAGLYESSSAAVAFGIFLIAAISMIFVEFYAKKTNTVPIKFNKAGIIGTIIIIFLIIIAIGGSQKNSQQIEGYYTEGINNFNNGISFTNKGNTNLNEGDVSAAIAQFDIAKDFFSKAKTNFETVVKRSDSNANKNKAKYLMESSDYYGKGLDELMIALRLAEKYKGTGSLTTAIELIRNPESITTISSELLEIKVSSEKAKNYFDLARNSKDSADIA